MPALPPGDVPRLAVELTRALLARLLLAGGQPGRHSGASAYGPSRDEIAAALRGDPPTRASDDELRAADARVAAASDALNLALAPAPGAPEAPLARLARVFQLAGVDVGLVAALLGPELDHPLERALAFALDDFTRKRPDVAFLARLVGATSPGLGDLVLTRLDDGAPLRRHGVVVLGAPAEPGPAALRTVRLADRVVAFLRGHDTLDEQVRHACRPGGRPRLDDLVLPAPLVAQVRRALAPAPLAPGQPPSPPRLLLAGPEGVGRGLLVEALCAEAGRPTLRIDLAALAADPRPGERLAAALREAALRDATAILDGGPTLKEDVPRALALAVADAGDLAVPLVFTLAVRPAWLAHALPELLELTVPAPTFRERIALWRRALPPPLADDADLEAVAARYAFTGATIAGAARRAAAAARLRAPDEPRVTLDDLGDAARLTFSGRLGGMAQRIPTGFRWSDLVLPADTLDAVREIVRFARRRPFLLEEWGFAAKLPYGRGVSAILAGPPGTGKTMVAQLLAQELGYDLYRIDLSQVVNKYIGETEKNLARIFEEAEASHAVLFFDEADALFAKRTEVKSSNDRYANLEVNYLLQRMETYDGVTLLATNLEQGLDEAFKRRVRFSVAFELPEEPERRRLWRSMFPPQVPLADDLDWDAIAARFEMAGGYIKKAALRAALLAAEAGRAVSTEDLLAAAQQEYREMGRVV